MLAARRESDEKHLGRRVHTLEWDVVDGEGSLFPQQKLGPDDLFLREVVWERCQLLGEVVDAPILANESPCAGLDWAEVGRRVHTCRAYCLDVLPVRHGVDHCGTVGQVAPGLFGPRGSMLPLPHPPTRSLGLPLGSAPWSQLADECTVQWNEVGR